MSIPIRREVELAKEGKYDITKIRNMTHKEWCYYEDDFSKNSFIDRVKRRWRVRKAEKEDLKVLLKPYASTMRLKKRIRIWKILLIVLGIAMTAQISLLICIFII